MKERAASRWLFSLHGWVIFGKIKHQLPPIWCSKLPLRKRSPGPALLIVRIAPNRDWWKLMGKDRRTHSLMSAPSEHWPECLCGSQPHLQPRGHLCALLLRARMCLTQWVRQPRAPGSRRDVRHRTLGSGHGEAGSRWPRGSGEQVPGRGAWWRNDSSFPVLEQPRCGRKGAALTAQPHLGQTPQRSYLQAKVPS